MGAGTSRVNPEGESPLEPKTPYQVGIVSGFTRAALFITCETSSKRSKLNRTSDYLEDNFDQCGRELGAAICKLPRLISQYDKDINSPLYGVVAVSSPVYQSVFDSSAAPFAYTEVHGHQEYSHFPATGGHIFINLKADRRDLLFSVARSFLDQVKLIRVDGNSIIKSVSETEGFVYEVGENGFGRDLTGFEDGTKNPRTLEAQIQAAIVPLRSGSYVLVQKWIHDLTSWEKQTESQQECIVGRKKTDSAKLDPNPPTSHVSLVDLGKRKIVRHSMPFGSASEHGLYFLAYSSDLDRMDEMLQNMISASKGNSAMDLMKYSRCVMGQYYYAPSAGEMERYLNQTENECL
ncbi:iron-dependent peroxidase [Planoprotostelium fungivorum]|uniref:Iron-dependent peroxidase n=1 Tax=Planoprotostelium fungivorum TaxID=1890364 RepID=A0A2P6MM40_9EUKA|nr:iron-dependent peroxidase [Planoprotostelium fungivorum]